MIVLFSLITLVFFNVGKFTGEQEFKNIKRTIKLIMKPGLYIVATPIGNLSDFSIRAQNTLNKVDIIVCENPSHSLKLLSKFGIKKKLYSLHDHNEDKIIEKIQVNLINKSIALISDAGSPLISDPGYKLVKFYIDKKLLVTSVPGPSAIISSLQISGMPIHSFKFFGFSPKTKNKIIKFIEDLEKEYQTSIFFTSSHKLILCLEIIAKKFNHRKISVCKELTKLNEKVFRGYAQDVIEEIMKDKKNILGEFVILVEGGQANTNNYEHIRSSIDKQINKLLKKYSLTDVVEIVHNLTNISKKTIYKRALEQKK